MPSTGRKRRFFKIRLEKIRCFSLVWLRSVGCACQFWISFRWRDDDADILRASWKRKNFTSPIMSDKESKTRNG